MKKENVNKRYFFDMDGVAAKYISTKFPWWLEPNIFRELEPQQDVINAIKHLIHTGKEVYTLSAYHLSTPQVKTDKIYWLSKHLPEIDDEHMIFTLCGQNKADYIPTGLKETDILLDDFNPNLTAWEDAGGTAIKILNGINSKESWLGISVSAFDTDEIINTLMRIPF